MLTATLNVMIDRKMRKNEKEGVMQRENERIIYHLMHFNKKDKEWSERPYLLLEDMAIVFDILDLDDRSIHCLLYTSDAADEL